MAHIIHGLGSLGFRIVLDYHRSFGGWGSGHVNADACIPGTPSKESLLIRSQSGVSLLKSLIGTPKLPHRI